MSAWPTFGGCQAIHLQQTICLAIDFLYLVECNCLFDVDFMWYLLCLIQPKFWDLLLWVWRVMQRKICLVEPIMYSVRCPCSFQFSFMWYPQCLIKPIIGALIWGSRGHPQQGVPGRHPYLIMESYTLYVPVLRCWYLVRLTKMLWAAARYCFEVSYIPVPSIHLFVTFNLGTPITSHDPSI